MDQKPKLLKRLLFIADILLTGVALFVADYARRHIPVGRAIDPVPTFLNPFLYILAALVWAFVLHTFSIYEPSRIRRLRDEFKELTFAVPTAVFIFAGFLYFSFRDVPRLLMLYFLVLDILFLCIIRLPRQLLFRHFAVRGNDSRRWPSIRPEGWQQPGRSKRDPGLAEWVASRKHLTRCLVAVDVLLTLFTFFLADYARRHIPIGRAIDPVPTFLNPLLYVLAAAVWTYVLHTFSMYDFRRLSRLRDELRELSLAVPTSVFILAGLLYFSYRDVPRLLMLYFLALNLAWLAAARLPREPVLRYLKYRERSRRERLEAVPAALEDLQARPSVSVLGVPVCPCSEDEAIRYVTRFVDDHRHMTNRAQGAMWSADGQLTIAYANAHTVNVACKDAEYRAILQSVDIVCCDGAGVVLGARLLGEHLPGRMAAADWIYPLARTCASEGISLYLLGGKTGVAEMAATRLRALYPQLAIVSTHEGYIASSIDKSLRVVADINRAAPDILLVGMGTPLQEKWIATYRERIRVPVFWAVGALFEFVAGVVPRAPHWMMDHSMEWLFRLMMEPRRLGQRYLWGNPLFICRVFRQRISGNDGRSVGGGAVAVKPR